MAADKEGQDAVPGAAARCSAYLNRLPLAKLEPRIWDHLAHLVLSEMLLEDLHTCMCMLHVHVTCYMCMCMCHVHVSCARVCAVCVRACVCACACVGIYM